MSPQDPINQIVPLPPPVPQSSRRTLVLLLGGVTVLFILIVIGAFYFWNTKNIPQPITLEKRVENITPMQVPDDWKTYDGGTWKFSYPSNFVLEDVSKKSSTIDVSMLSLSAGTTSNEHILINFTPLTKRFDAQALADIRNSNPQMDMLDAILNLETPTVEFASQYGLTVLKSNKISIGGLVAAQFASTGRLVSEEYPTYRIRTTFNKSEELIDILMDVDHVSSPSQMTTQTYSTILSSFGFK